MKKQLLLLFAMVLLAGSTFAQTIAYPVPDLVQCNDEVFNLTVQDSVVLGDQDPATHSITYYTSPENAQNQDNPIVNPTFYIPSQSPTVFVRVTNEVDDTFGVTSFNVTIHIVGDITIPNVYACSSYTLPTLPQGYEYRTAPNGGGTTVAAGTIITATQTLYLSSFQCPLTSGFTVTIGALNVPDFADVQACGSYILPALPAGNYYTAPGGTGNMLTAGTQITTTHLIYVFAQDQSCSAEESFVVTILPSMAIDPENVAVCGSYILPALENGGYYTAPGGPEGNGEVLPAGTAISTSQTLYLYLVSGGCILEGEFNITILESDTIQLDPILGCENDIDEGTFDLNQAVAQIQQTIPNARVRFFLTAMDAATNANPIPNVYSSVTATIYTGITIPDNCYYTMALDLVVTQCADPVVTGVVRLDGDVNGCTADDAGVSGLQVSLSINGLLYNTFTNSNGEYAFYNIPQGVAGLLLSNINTSIYTADNPAYDLSIEDDPVVRDFCLTATEPVTDVLVNVWPSTNVVPGFNAGYYIEYFNAGTTTESGDVVFTYDTTKYTFVSSSIPGTATGNTLTFAYTNLAAGSSGYIYLEFTVAQPPVLNLDDIVTISTNITPLTGDAYPDNNTYTLTQIVTDSFDPNDITVDKGETITLDQADEYLQYTIRFQNMGTANATNVRVTSILDPNLNWSTFEPIGATHTYRVVRTGQDVIFNFDNIQLPYESANEPASHGSVSYRIKPKSTIQVGDAITALASIYFDFNEAIETNMATTTVIATTGLNTFYADGFVMYPNPAEGLVNIKFSNPLVDTAVTITDVLGKTVLTTKLHGTQAVLNVASLTSGMYFINLDIEGNRKTKKLIVK
jgi:uncharacterized repeat protein (TIGR01451 family)